MSYSFNWEVPDRVGYFSFGETYSMEDAAHLNSQILEMLDHSTQSLHIMIDIANLKHYPIRMNEETWSMTTWLRHQRLGWLIIINQGTNPMANFMVSTVGKTIGVKTRFVKTPEEAIETLHRMDLTLSAA